MLSRVVHATYFDTPPSLNKVGSRGSRWAYSREKKKWQGICEGLLMEHRVPKGLVRVKATAVLTFPRANRRDEGNYRFMLEKALGDALVSGGWLVDDGVDEYRFGRIRFEKGARHVTLLKLRYWLPPA